MSVCSSVGSSTIITTASKDTILGYSHGHRLETRQDGRRRPRQYTLRGKHSSAIVSYNHWSSWEYLTHTQANPPGQHTQSQADTYTSGSYTQAHTYAPGNTRLVKHVCSRHRKEESMVIPECSQQASASIQLAARNHIMQHDPTACPCHKPGTKSAWGVAPDVTGTTWLTCGCDN
ncbi:hypothetical protein DPMN_102091 [Dreissena polymorpha]|uniref:Uncharacterized protein n=1 Tax=Dreissena polymorpha TaxID=45954 RepID=A0A9D4LK23_DREPO|nr:hypothetical protein DPMN_102091 [Dreissena polymorpha]